MSKIDRKASSITIGPDGLLRIDEIPLLKLVRYEGDLWIQVKDGNRQRNNVRGSDCVMVPLDWFIAKIVKMAMRQGS